MLDLCCGIGADLLAFDRAGLPVNGVERDPVTAAVARPTPPAGLRIDIGAAEDADWRSAEAVFCDPARRAERGRTFDPAGFSPGLDFVLAAHRRPVRGRQARAGYGPRPGPGRLEAEWVSCAAG